MCALLFPCLLFSFCSSVIFREHVCERAAVIEAERIEEVTREELINTFANFLSSVALVGQRRIFVLSRTFNTHIASLLVSAVATKKAKFSRKCTRDPQLLGNSQTCPGAFNEVVELSP